MARPRVLYVDDEPALLELTQMFLANDCDMDVEEDPSKVRDRLKATHYDVVVSDYQMPDMDGVKLLKELRAGGDVTPFILFTGKGREEVAIEALNSGADFYLQKGGNPSVQFGELRNAIVQLYNRRLVETSLMQSERRYRDLVEGANTIILKMSLDGRVTYMNRYGRRFFGLEAMEVSESAESLANELTASFDFIKDKIHGLLTNPQGMAGHNNTYPMTMRDGRNVWVSWSVTIVRDEDGRPSELLIFGSDVTAAKRAELELERAMSLTRASLDTSDEGIIVIAKGGDVLEHNRRYREMWDIGDKPLNIMNKERVVRDLRYRIKDPDEYFDHIDRCLKDRSKEHYYTIELLNGRTYDEYTAPFRVGEEIVGRYWSYKDITEKKVMERALKDQKEEYSGLLAAIPDLVLKTELDGRITYVNDKIVKVSGYSRDELLGQSVFSFIAPEDVGKAVENMQKMISGDLGPVAYHLKIKDETRMLFEANGDIIWGSDGNPHGAVIVGRDITEHHRLEQALKEANAKLRIMTSISRHDTLNKIMAIQGLLELDRMRTKSPAMAEHLEKLQKLVKALAEQAEFTKEYQSMGASNPKWQSVSEVFNRAASRFGTTDVHFTVSTGGAAVYADPMLEKVFYNLVDNSLKHGRTVKNISVSAIVDGGTMLITYADDGVGLTTHERAHVFEEGFGKDHGLGLFLSREILAITGITIAEQGEGSNGVRFEIRVPEGTFQTDQAKGEATSAPPTVGA